MDVEVKILIPIGIFTVIHAVLALSVILSMEPLSGKKEKQTFLVYTLSIHTSSRLYVIQLQLENR